ncbi:MAG: hypothetical protein M0R06_20240 [Sphaerochaeta sp.]|jgi:hypothetical protein|nr:hypothetical protein [Sphaerochaeta sp.]
MRTTAIIETAMATALLAALCLAQTQECPEQVFMDPNIVPFAVDVNHISVDPGSGQRLLLGYVITDVGREWSYPGWVCDPDGNPVTISASAGTLEKPTATTYVLWGMEQTTGVTYYHISATDVPLEHQEPLTRTGTVAVLAVPQNRRPTLCGGRP